MDHHIGPHTNHISRLYNQTELGSRGTKRIKMHREICLLLTGNLVFLDIRPYLKKGKQHGRVKDGRISRNFIKQGKMWIELL